MTKKEMTTRDANEEERLEEQRRRIAVLREKYADIVAMPRHKSIMLAARAVSTFLNYHDPETYHAIRDDDYGRRIIVRVR